MRRLALPIVICLASSYGCAASEDSMPPENTTHAGSASVVPGSSGSGGAAPIATGGTATVATGGTTTTGTAGTSGTTTTTGTAGTTTTTGTAGTAPVGSAGTTGTGGAAPGGGTCMTTSAAMGAMPMIDDFEDGNADVSIADGRQGGWYFSVDGTGMTTPKAGAPVPEAGGMPGKAVHVTGTGLTSWGASLSAAIVPNMGCYDASKYTGITVMLKGTGSVWVSVLTAAVRAAPVGMQNQFKKQVTLTADWQPVTISFTELTQPGGWGTIVPFDVTKIYGIDFGPATAPPTATAFDFWVDNLSFK